LDTYSGQLTIKQLEKCKGGYFYLSLDAEIVDQFERKKATRIICTIDDEISYRCGLNHLGDGNFFVIVATKYLDQLGKQLDDTVNFKIDKDPDQLGVEMPEVLGVFLEQDSESKKIFDKLTDGKKRSLVFGINKIKNIDRQIQAITEFLAKQNMKMEK